MEDLVIEPTVKTPLVNFFSTGKLILAGSLYSENAPEFFDPLITWIRNFKAAEVDFDIIIEYMNTASAKQLLRLLLLLKDNKQIKQIKINWFYEAEDEEGLETGQILDESIPGIDFNFTLYERKTE